MDNVILGRNIYKARRDRGLSSDKLSDLCDITPSYLRQVEAGSKTPSLPLFVELCNQLNVSPAYLMSGVVNDTVDQSIEEIAALYRKATPSQLKLIAVILKAVCEACE